MIEENQKFIEKMSKVTKELENTERTPEINWKIFENKVFRTIQESYNLGYLRGIKHGVIYCIISLFIIYWMIYFIKAI